MSEIVGPVFAVWVSRAGARDASTVTVVASHADCELHIERVCLLGDQLQVVEDLLLEAGLLNSQCEVVWWKSVEVEDAGVIRCSYHGLVGLQVLESKGRTRDGQPVRIGDGALNGRAKLCVSQLCNE